MRFVLAIVVALVGCGPDGGGTGIEGQWEIEANDGTDCSLLLTIEGDDFSLLNACTLGSGEVGIEGINGSLEVFAEDVIFHPLEATCPDTSPDPVTNRYIVDKDQLTLLTGTGALVYERSQDDDEPGGSGRIIFGCWEGDTLIPMPWAAL